MKTISVVMVKGEHPMETIKTRITKLLTSKPELLQNLNLSPRRVLLLVNHLIENGVTIRERGRWEPHPNHPGFDRCPICHDCIIGNDWADGKKWNFCPHCGSDLREEGSEEND